MKKKGIEKKEFPIIKKTIEKGLTALLMILRGYIQKGIDIERIARVGLLLNKSGVSIHNSIFQEIARRLSTQQKSDGGWVGVEDSIWNIAFMKEFEEYSRKSKIGLNWLRKQQLESGGWGKTSRDIGRIPITGLLLYLLPELSNNESMYWLENDWKKEFCLRPRLTYKGAFSIMAIKTCKHQFAERTLLDKTLDWLASQQNEDCGWGPCKGHPVGSTPFCTGIAIAGLLHYPKKINKKVISNGLEWIQKNQLEDGLWPDHYIEEGSIWSFYALTEGYKLLKGIN